MLKKTCLIKNPEFNVITFPSSNNLVNITIDCIRNSHIIRIKSYKVISVGAEIKFN